MQETEKAYIAGIVDGEGSIMLIKFHNNLFPSPCVSIASTTIELLEWIKSSVRYGRIQSKKNYDINKHKDSYTYTIRNDAAIALLIQIEPYLVIQSKKRRANMIINSYKRLTIRNGRYTQEQIHAKNKFYEDFMAIK